MNKETQEHLSSGAEIIVSVSGGKDSTACCLKLFEMGYSKKDFRRVFMDTGWEDRQTYEYLDYLEKHIGKIEKIRRNIDISQMPEEMQKFILQEEEKLGHQSDFLRLVMKKNIFPSHFRKYCTSNLKIEPFSDYIQDQDNDVIVVLGLRRAESRRRSKITEWEWNEKYNNYMWRPLYLWSEEDVINIHSRFNILPNRLYLQGANRVGCYPCIYSRKKEIKTLSQERIDLIDRIERFLGAFNFKTRFGVDPKLDRLLALRYESSGFHFQPMFNGDVGKDHIKNIHEWSKTSRGGKQLAMFDLEEPTCVKWGLCDFAK
jgi:3'-phosphoadenosine 5'-phosphosulfate sulfotransferase (PAPS reductase)/FAD synthetase